MQAHPSHVCLVESWACASSVARTLSWWLSAGDLFDGTLLVGDAGVEMWEVERPSGGKLMVEWGTEGDMFDPLKQVSRAPSRIGRRRSRFR